MVRQAHHRLKKLISLWLTVLLWMGLIFYLSAQPGLKVAEGAWDFWTRKPAHVGEYAVLFILFVRALKGSNYQLPVSPAGRDPAFRGGNLQLGVMPLAFLLSFLYAVTDEFHQFLVPLREGKLIDLGFDLLGIITGAFLLRFKRRRS